MSRKWKKVRDGARLLCIQEKRTPDRTAGENGLGHRTAGPAWMVDKVADFREFGLGWRRGRLCNCDILFIIENNIWSLAAFFVCGGSQSS